MSSSVTKNNIYLANTFMYIGYKKLFISVPSTK